jgi:dihydrofolate synthase / folylpolyglutamate synthase
VPGPDALARLFQLEQFGIKLGLTNIQRLVEALGHPERRFASVLIAGTNGKGSVAAMVERALRASGRRTGRYTSPHLVRLEERFAVDGAPAATAVVAEIAGHVLDRESATRRSDHEPATFFEVTTAVAFELFARAGVEIAVVEVGLGGRYDATNVVSPVASAIVSIDYDHTRHLGSTLEAIAWEKAGVMRSGVPVIVGDLPASAQRTVEATAREVGASFVAASDGVECLVQLHVGRLHARQIDAEAAPSDGEEGLGGHAPGHAEVRLDTPTRSYGPLVLGLAGRHQVGNAIVAVRLLEEIDSGGYQVAREDVETGLRDVCWPCRLEHVRLIDGRALLLDAAHNAGGARALAEHILETWGRPLPVVFSASADKDVAAMLDALAPSCAELTVTQMATPRGAPLDVLSALAAHRLPGRVQAVTPPTAALEAALARHRLVCVAGSIFLLGELLPHIENLRAPVSA